MCITRYVASLTAQQLGHLCHRLKSPLVFYASRAFIVDKYIEMVSFTSSNIEVSCFIACAPISRAVYTEWPRADCGAAVLRCHDDLTHNVVSSCMPQERSIQGSSEGRVRRRCCGQTGIYIHVIVLMCVIFIYACAKWIP